MAERRPARRPQGAHAASARRTVARAAIVAITLLAGAGCGGASHQASAPVLNVAGLSSATGPTGADNGPGAPVTVHGGEVAASSTATKATGGGATAVPGALPLSGRIVTVDPGHNGGNFTHPQEIGRLVNDGDGFKECDTTGAAAPDGYRETDFNWDVALRLVKLLQQAGARVVMTRHGNDGVGPCITERAAIGNRAHSDVALSIHADGGPPSGSGFAILVPAPIPSRADQSIIAPSHRFGVDLRAALEGIGLHTSTYDGVDGISPRTNLGGLNLSRVPKAFVEVGNMRNGPDEAPMERPSYRQHVAEALLAGIERFLPER